jgi:hypothetical protein
MPYDLETPPGKQDHFVGTVYETQRGYTGRWEVKLVIP